jgi:hypothetical protein
MAFNTVKPSLYVCSGGYTNRRKHMVDLEEYYVMQTKFFPYLYLTSFFISSNFLLSTVILFLLSIIFLITLSFSFLFEDHNIPRNNRGNNSGFRLTVVQKARLSVVKQR